MYQRKKCFYKLFRIPMPNLRQKQNHCRWSDVIDNLIFWNSKRKQFSGEAFSLKQKSSPVIFLQINLRNWVSHKKSWIKVSIFDKVEHLPKKRSRRMFSRFFDVTHDWSSITKQCLFWFKLRLRYLSVPDL